MEKTLVEASILLCRIPWGKVVAYQDKSTMNNKSVEALPSKIVFFGIHPIPLPEKYWFSTSKTVQTTVPTQHWIGEPGVSEN